MIVTLAHHKRASETLEIMDLDKDFYAAQYLRGVIVNSLQGAHIFRKDLQIAFEKGLHWEPGEAVYGDFVAQARASQQK